MTTSRTRCWLQCMLVALALPACAVPPADSAPPQNPWSDVPAEEAPKRPFARININPTQFRLVRLDAQVLDTILSQTAEISLTLPKPRGGEERFRLWPTQVMSPELAAQLAAQGWAMKTYAGSSLDRPATSLSLDWGGIAGLHAAVIGPEESYYLDPRYAGDRVYYASYYKADLPRTPRRGDEVRRSTGK